LNPNTGKQMQSTDFVLEPDDNQRLAELCGEFDEHLRQVERRMGVEISNRGNAFHVIGSEQSVQATRGVIDDLYAETGSGSLNPEKVHLYLQQAGVELYSDGDSQEPVEVKTRRKLIRARGANQQRYLHVIREHAINFGVGPAGTGKTYLAVAAAVEVLEREQVSRVVLARPAVEAGERLGFLPGDLAQKIDPYLRPLYDALYEMLGFERVARLIEKDVIEVAPLAYMRGRTLNNSFIILDEAQNTTVEQMKMFLTRIGFGSIAVINGDITQVDLPKGRQSGLRQVIEVLKDVEGISFTFFHAGDVVRHPLVAKILRAYEASGLDGKGV